MNVIFTSTFSNIYICITEISYTNTIRGILLILERFNIGGINYVSDKDQLLEYKV